MTIFCAYIFGSVPFAAIISRMYGVDILRNGSGNAGATNVRRVVGKFASRLVFLLDFGKGMLAAYLPLLVFGSDSVIAHRLACIAVLSAVIGHNFSIFLCFRGGKGVAVTIGGMLVIVPQIVLLALIVWYVMFKVTRIVSLASLAFALALPFSTYLFSDVRDDLWLSYALALLIFVMHNKNIMRLLAGTEMKWDK